MLYFIINFRENILINVKVNAKNIMRAQLNLSSKIKKGIYK